MNKLKYIIYVLVLSTFFTTSCRESKSRLLSSDSSETIKKETPVPGDLKLIRDAADYVLTGINISNVVSKKVSGLEPIDEITSFIKDRNMALKLEIDTVARALDIAIISEPSSDRMKDIEKIIVTKNRQEMIDAYKNWMLQYSNQLQITSRKMIDDESNQSLIVLGSKINAYSHALEREYERLDKMV